MMDESTTNNFQFPQMSSGMKKLIIGYIGIFVLLLGTLIGLQLVQQPGVGEIRKQAAGVAGGATVQFNTLTSAQRILIPGKESVTVPISMATNQQAVTAADLSIQFTYPNPNTPLLDFTGLSGNQTGYFDQPANSYGPLTTYTLYNQSQNAGSYDTSTRIARIALGAPCDRCYLGPTPIPTPGQPTIAPCSTIPENPPKCYPKPTGTAGNGILANLVVRARPNVVGKTTLGFVPFNSSNNTGTAVAGLGSDTDVVNTLGASIGICTAYDFDKNASTNGLDVARVATRFNSHPGDGRYDVAYDLNGTSGAGDGVINGLDFALVATRFNTTCTP
jgi:hypothetical protein